MAAQYHSIEGPFQIERFYVMDDRFCFGDVSEHFA